LFAQPTSEQIFVSTAHFRTNLCFHSPLQNKDREVEARWGGEKGKIFSKFLVFCLLWKEEGNQVAAVEEQGNQRFVLVFSHTLTGKHIHTYLPTYLLADFSGVPIPSLFFHVFFHFTSSYLLACFVFELFAHNINVGQKYFILFYFILFDTIGQNPLHRGKEHILIYV